MLRVSSYKDTKLLCPYWKTLYKRNFSVLPRKHHAACKKRTEPVLSWYSQVGSAMYYNTYYDTYVYVYEIRLNLCNKIKTNVLGFY